MATSVPPAVSQTEDPVSNVLKWILLVVAIGSFGLFAWATVLTYERAPPQPERFVTSGGATLMTGDDILAGKGGFQKADLMDFGSLYGMGSYFGQDYTAFGLMRLATLTENGLAQTRFGKAFDALSPEQQAAVRNTMREQLQRVDLTRQEVVVPDALAGAITALRDRSGGQSRQGGPRHRLDARLQPGSGRGAAYRRLPDLLRPHHRRPPARCELVLDRELAV